MASLKDLRRRIGSVKSTRKITSAMKLVAGSKLRRAQDAAVAARPYAERMERMLGRLASAAVHSPDLPALLTGTGRDDRVLIVAVTAERGLCGGFNTAVNRATRNRVNELRRAGKSVQVITIGRKGRDYLRREHRDVLSGHFEMPSRGTVAFHEASAVARQVLDRFQAGEFDVCEIIFNRFKSAISQIVTRQQLIPFPAPAADAGEEKAADAGGPKGVYEFEPSEEEILEKLLPSNVAVQIYSIMLESAASEQGARMVAMDNATRNAGQMINRLTLVYNRTRQAVITKELIEIISGAEAL